MGWGIKVHVDVPTSSTLTSNLVILDDTSGLRWGWLGWGGVGWGINVSPIQKNRDGHAHVNDLSNVLENSRFFPSVPFETYTPVYGLSNAKKYHLVN